MYKSLFSLMVVVFLAGCATDGGVYRPQSQQQNSVYGTIYSVDHIPLQVNDTSGVGIAGGAVVGGLLGNRVGKGNGRKLATILGAVGGGYAGNEIEKNSNRRTVQGVNMRIRLDSGQQINVVQRDQGFRSGTRVRLIQQNGQWQVAN